MHEQSETIRQEHGYGVPSFWWNVYGHGTPQAGQPLPVQHDWEPRFLEPGSSQVVPAPYRSREDALMAAILRSLWHGAMHPSQYPQQTRPYYGIQVPEGRP